jgi:ABC-type dipeptide/oligopeptide/nickel transport system permease subunit
VSGAADNAPPAHRARRGWLRLAVAVPLVLLLGVIALFPGTVARLSPADPDPHACALRADDGTFRDNLPPSSEHWFGTDVQGCDYFTRVVHGARVSLAVAVGATAIAVVIGGVLGGAAGFLGGRSDRVITRVTDLFIGLPQVLTAIVLLTVLGGETRSVWEIAVVLGVLGWPFAARITRAAVLATRAQPYVDAAMLAGVSRRRALATHVVPNSATPLVVFAAVGAGVLIGVEAALAFLGVGLAPPAISWGLMIEPAQSRLSTSPHLMLFPALFIATAVLAFLLLGDALQDALDPRESR